MLKVKAKAVMERDLALIRTKRVERERVAAGLKAHSPSDEEISDMPVNGLVKNVQVDSSGNIEKEPERIEDVVMGNGNSNTGAAADTVVETVDIPPAVKKGDGDLAKQRGDVGADTTALLAASMVPPERNNDQTKSNQNGDQIVPQPEQSGTPPATDFQDITFESMFDDNGTTGDNDQMDFDLGFTNDTNIDEDFLNDSAFENITMNNDAVKDLNTTSNEDINTLLPGLENYVNAGDDFSLTDIAASNPAVLPHATNLSRPTDQTAAASATEQAPIESNFDDFFASGNYMDGAGDDDMGEDGGFGDFDDSWFGTDVGKADGP